MNMSGGKTAIGILSFVAFATASLFGQDDIAPVETTGAYKLLTIEADVRGLPPSAQQLFRSVITEATEAAIGAHRQPANRDEALDVFKAIQTALVKHNFLQPLEQKDWPQTLGEAFNPIDRSDEEMKRILASAYNASRVQYFDLSKPFFFVDCDMGSQLFMAVAERLGWDVRLVEVPDHNFVRWHMPSGTTVNWDWTHGQSLSDSYYSSAVSNDVRLRALYLRSYERAEAKAYFLGLVASKATKREDAERLFMEALKVVPPNPTTLNNVAWLYATRFAKDRDKTDLAVRYGLDAWSTKPNDGNVADTVACAFAANGQKEMAKTVEEFAIRHANSQTQTKSFSENRARIDANEPCQ